MQSGHRSDDGRLTRFHNRYGSVLGLLALVAVAAVYGWSTWHDRAVERERAGTVRVGIEVPLPFSADSGGAEGILRLRNDGPLALAVLTLGFQDAGLRLVSENLPLHVDAESTRLIVVRVEIDCTGETSTPRSLVMRTRTSDAQERLGVVRVDALDSIVSDLRRDACDPPVLPIAEQLSIAYAGITKAADERITTRVLVSNERDTPVTIVRISAVSGLAGARPLRVLVPAGDAPATQPADRGSRLGRLAVRPQRVGPVLDRPAPAARPTVGQRGAGRPRAGHRLHPGLLPALQRGMSLDRRAAWWSSIRGAASSLCG